MKNFFKKLALVMALVLIIGSVPAMQAKAADAKLTRTTKTLFVNVVDGKKVGALGYVGLKEKPEKKSVLKYTYKIKTSNVAADAVLTYKSSDKTIAGVSKNGKVFARKAGTAVITVKADGVEIGTLTVTVETNATKVEITNAPENGTVGIGSEVYDLAGSQDGTDRMSYKIDDKYKDIAKVDAYGKITTLKPGKFEVVCYTYQSKTYTGVTAESAPLALEAVVNSTEVKQKSQNEIKITFDSDMTKVAAEKDFVVYNIVADATKGEAKNTITNNKVTVDETGKVVVLSLWGNFVAGTKYYVEYLGKVIGEFEAATLRAQDAVSIEIITTEVAYTEAKEIEYKVLDAKGIEIPKDDNAMITFTSDSADCAINGNTIFFYEKGKTATVKADYAVYYYNDKSVWTKHTVPTGIGIIKSIDIASATVTNFEWNLVSAIKLPSYFDTAYTKLDYMSTSDEDGLYLAVRATLSDNSKVGADSFIYESSNTNILFVEKTADQSALKKRSGVKVKPVSVGTANILVFGMDQNGEKSSTTPIKVIPIQIKPKRVATKLVLSTTSNYLNTASAASLAAAYESLIDDDFDYGDDDPDGGTWEDSIVITAKIYDQYDKLYGNFNADGIKVERVGGKTLVDTVAKGLADKSALAYTEGASSFTFTVDRDWFDSLEGNITFRAVVTDKAGNKTSPHTATINMSCKLPDASKDVYKLAGVVDIDTAVVDTRMVAIAAQEELDDIVLSGLADYQFAVTIQEYNGNYRVDDKQVNGFVLDDTTKDVAGETRYVYNVYKSGAVVDTKYITDTANTSHIFKAYSTSALGGAYIDKIATGSYYVQLSKVVVNASGNRKSVTRIDSKNFSVSDNQEPLTFEQVKFDVDNKENIMDAYEGSFFGSDVTEDATFACEIGSNTSTYAYVKNLQLKLVGADFSYILKTPVNKVVSYIDN